MAILSQNCREASEEVRQGRILRGKPQRCEKCWSLHRKWVAGRWSGSQVLGKAKLHREISASQDLSS